jgi:hypothetical protein
LKFFNGGEDKRVSLGWQIYLQQGLGLSSFGGVKESELLDGLQVLGHD